LPRHDMKRLKATIHPVSFWMSLTQVSCFMLVTVETFSSFASMSWALTIYPRRIPDGTPKMHLVGFSFHQKFFKVVNVSFRSAMRLLAILDLTATLSI
jgi:hypothetical protein